MIAYDFDEEKEFEKAYEWDALSATQRGTTLFGDLLPQGALPYVQSVASKDELHELLMTLQECMSGLEYRRLIPKVRRFYPKRWLRETELRPSAKLQAVN